MILRFKKDYKNMWQMIMKSDHEGCKQIQTALAALRLPEKASMLQ
jgi:hypothetical protein